MERHRMRRACVLFALAASTGCVPQDSGSIVVPAGLSNAALVDCVEATVRELHGADEQWSLRITRRDVARGRFETGDFDRANVMGYRLRLVRDGDAARATLSVRAAGPYFTDLGAERALSNAQARLATCLARAPH